MGSPGNPERVAFLLHRLTGLILVVYFTLHAASMGCMFSGWGCSGLASGLIASKSVRLVVGVSAVYHGLNGVRLLLVEALGLGVGRPGIPRPPYLSASLRSAQRYLLYAAFLVSIALSVAVVKAVW